MDATPVRDDQSALDASGSRDASVSADWSAAPFPPGVSRTLLRFLLLGQGIGPGARILDVGSGCANWVRSLRWLGLVASGLGNVPADATAARTACPEADVRWTPRLSRVPWESHAFDVVVVRDRPEWSGSLVGPTVRDALASLLSVVRPGGRLIVAQRLPQGRRDESAGHGPECHAQSLEHFPGRTSQHSFGDGIADPGAWRWLLGFGARPGWRATVHRVPPIAVAASEWSRHAGAVLSSAACCDYGAQADAVATESAATRHRRAA